MAKVSDFWPGFRTFGQGFGLSDRVSDFGQGFGFRPGFRISARVSDQGYGVSVSDIPLEGFGYMYRSRDNRKKRFSTFVIHSSQLGSDRSVRNTTDNITCN